MTESPSATWFPRLSMAAPLSSVRTGDWIYMDLAHGELQVVGS